MTKIEFTTPFVVGYDGRQAVGVLGPYASYQDASGACQSMRGLQPGRRFFVIRWKDLTAGERKLSGCSR